MSARTRTALAMGLRTYRRMPLLLILLVALPAYLLIGFSVLLPDTTVRLMVPGEGPLQASMLSVYVALLTPLVAALVAGIAGLFLMRATRAADARLVVAGYRAREVVLARFALVGGVGVLVTAVAVGTTWASALSPVDLPGFVAATLLAALLYGLVGVLAGVVLDRLGGVYLVLFGSMIDMFLFQNPLVADRAAVARFLPGHVPVELAIDAGFSGGVDLSTLALGTAYVAVLVGLAAVAFWGSLRLD